MLCDGLIHIKPQCALKDIRKADLIFIPTTGLGIQDVVERNEDWISGGMRPWLRVVSSA